MPTFGDWEYTVLSEAYENIDYVSLHRYYANPTKDTKGFLARTMDMDDFIKTVVAICDAVKGKKVALTITQISYYYNEDMEGKNGVPYKAEEWITDKLAVNKKGTKLYPRSGKFRRKTVDRVEEIFQGFIDTFSTKQGVVED